MTPPSLKTSNFSFRIYEIYANAIERAAKAKGVTPSKYARDLLTEWAYSDLGEALPALPELERGRYSGVVQKAASEMGMSRQEFEHFAALTLAEKVFSERPPAPDAPSKSGTRTAVRAPSSRKTRSR